MADKRTKPLGIQTEKERERERLSWEKDMASEMEKSDESSTIKNS